MTRTLLAFAFLLATPLAGAEIVGADDEVMAFRFEIEVPLGTGEAFERFVGEIDDWWSGSHTYSADAGNLSLDDGCFCERWGDNVVRHLEVVQYRPGKQVRLRGGLGPLQGLPLAGVMDVTFARADAGTTVSLTYRVLGRGLAGFAEPVDGVIGEQVERFHAHVSGE